MRKDSEGHSLYFTFKDEDNTSFRRYFNDTINIISNYSTLEHGRGFVFEVPRNKKYLKMALKIDKDAEKIGRYEEENNLFFKDAIDAEIKLIALSILFLNDIKHENQFLEFLSDKNQWR